MNCLWGFKLLLVPSGWVYYFLPAMVQSSLPGYITHSDTLTFSVLTTVRVAMLKATYVETEFKITGTWLSNKFPQWRYWKNLMVFITSVRRRKPQPIKSDAPLTEIYMYAEFTGLLVAWSSKYDQITDSASYFHITFIFRHS